MKNKQAVNGVARSAASLPGGAPGKKFFSGAFLRLEEVLRVGQILWQNRPHHLTKPPNRGLVQKTKLHEWVEKWAEGKKKNR